MEDWSDMVAKIPEDLKFKGFKAMEMFGGSFSVALAKAWFLADRNNKARIEAAFGDMLERYCGEFYVGAVMSAEGWC